MNLEYKADTVGVGYVEQLHQQKNFVNTFFYGRPRWPKLPDYYARVAIKTARAALDPCNRRRINVSPFCKWAL